MRFSQNWTYAPFVQLLEETCSEAGTNVSYEIFFTTLNPDGKYGRTELVNGTWWWDNFQEAFNSMHESNILGNTLL
jgi:hypothetical protein